MKLQSTEDRLATIDRSGGELELGCSMSRGRRGEAWAQNGIGGGRRSSWVLYIGQGGGGGERRRPTGQQWWKINPSILKP
jgi:hypothetical protein